MCEPISASTAAYIAIGSTVASTGATLIGQQAAGKAAQAKANYESKVASNNQIVAERNAADARERGKAQEQEHRIKIAQLKGRQRVVQAANGIEIDSGSALDILSDTAEIGELEALTIRNNAERQAVNFENQAQDFGVSSANSIIAGQNQSDAANFSSFGTLIGGAGSVAGQWYNFKK